jgi:hypothetical protein
VSEASSSQTSTQRPRGASQWPLRYHGTDSIRDLLACICTTLATRKVSRPRLQTSIVAVADSAGSTAAASNRNIATFHADRRQVGCGAMLFALNGGVKALKRGLMADRIARCGSQRCHSPAVMRLDDPRRGGQTQ